MRNATPGRSRQNICSAHWGDAMRDIMIELSRKFFEEDKQKHFYYSFFILLAAYCVLSLLWSIVFTTLVGVAKEIWDHYYGSGFCWWDLLANAIGMLAAALVILVFIH
jgi:hypothetical protein